MRDSLGVLVPSPAQRLATLLPLLASFVASPACGGDDESKALEEPALEVLRASLEWHNSSLVNTATLFDSLGVNDDDFDGETRLTAAGAGAGAGAGSGSGAGGATKKSRASSVASDVGAGVRDTVRQVLVLLVKAVSQGSWLPVAAALGGENAAASASLAVGTVQACHSLLAVSLRHLMHVASRKHKAHPDHPAMHELRRLAREVLRVAASHVAQLAADVDSVPSDAHAVVDAAVNGSYVGTLLPQLSTALCVVAGDKTLAGGIVGPALALYKALNALNAARAGAARGGASFGGDPSGDSRLGGGVDEDASLLAPAAAAAHKVWESPHPLPDEKQPLRETVTIPNASRLLVYFDSRCDVPACAGTVQLFSKPSFAVKDALTPKMQSGEGVEQACLLPGANAPVRVNGSAVTINLETTPRGLLDAAPWGIRIVVVEDLSAPMLVMPWLVDVQRTIGYLVGSAASRLVQGDAVSSDERKFGRFLHSRLMAGGLAAVKSSSGSGLAGAADHDGASTQASDVGSTVASSLPVQWVQAAQELGIDIESAFPEEVGQADGDAAGEGALASLLSGLTSYTGKGAKRLVSTLFKAQPGGSLVRKALFRDKDGVHLMAAAFGAMLRHSRPQLAAHAVLLSEKLAADKRCVQHHSITTACHMLCGDAHLFGWCASLVLAAGTRLRRMSCGRSWLSCGARQNLYRTGWLPSCARHPRSKRWQATSW